MKEWKKSFQDWRLLARKYCPAALAKHRNPNWHYFDKIQTYFALSEIAGIKMIFLLHKETLLSLLSQ